MVSIFSGLNRKCLLRICEDLYRAETLAEKQIHANEIRKRNSYFSNVCNVAKN